MAALAVIQFSYAAPGAASAPASGPVQGPFSSQFVQMSRSLKLTAEQKGKLKEQIDAMDRELESFRAAAVKKSREAIAVIESKDGAERDKLRAALAEEQKKASEDYEAIIDKYQAGIHAELTADQRLEWETYKLNRAIWGRLGFDLTDAQRKQIRQMIDKAAKEVVEAKDSAAVLSINGKLVRKLVTGVLTEEQAARLFSAAPPGLTGLGTIPGPKATPIDRNLP
jgi:Spy/CpxP family protein refolding chaperone